MGYINWTNVDAGFVRPYRPGDRLVRGWSGEIDADPARPLIEVAEAVYSRHNFDDRPDGRLCPSMSIGDVVVFGEVALSVDACGFVPVALDPADLITDRSWQQVIAADRRTEVAGSIMAGWAAPPPAPSPVSIPEPGLGL